MVKIKQEFCHPTDFKINKDQHDFVANNNNFTRIKQEPGIEGKYF